MKLKFTLIVFGFTLIVSCIVDAQITSTDDQELFETASSNRAVVEESTTLDPETKGQILSLYDQTLSAIERAVDWSNRIADYERTIEEAPSRLESSERSIQELTDEEAIPEIAAAAELARVLGERESELQILREEVGLLNSEPGRRAQRRRDMPELTALARERVRTLGEDAATPRTADESPELFEAHRLNVAARQRAREQELAAYGKELESYEKTSRLLLSETTLATQQLALLERAVEQLHGSLSLRRAEQVTQAASDARRLVEAADRLHPDVQAIAQEVSDEVSSLTERYMGSSSSLSSSAATRVKRDEILATLAKFRADLETKKEMAAVAGSSVGLGLVLREQAETLPDAGFHRRNVALRHDELTDVQLELIRIREQWRRIASEQTEAIRSIFTVQPALSESESIEAKAILLELFDIHRQTLEELINDYESHFAVLVDLNGLEIDLADEAGRYRDFIDENILFIRSGTLPSAQTVRDTLEALRWLTDPEGWSSLIAALVNDIVQYPLLYILTVCLFLAYFFLRRRWLALLPIWGATASARGNVKASPTIMSAVVTIILGLPIPILLVLMAWRVSASDPITEFDHSVTVGLWASAALLAFIGVSASILRSDGIAVCHFGWPAAQCAALRNAAWFFAPLLAISGMVVWVIEGSENEIWRESAGRAFFALMMLSPLLFACRTLRVRSDALVTLITRDTKAGGNRRLFIARTIAVGIPVFLLALSLFGYYYTALHLARPVIISIFFFLAVLYASRIATLLLLFARRRFARKQAQLRREARAEVGTSEAGVTVEEEVDLVRVDLQTERFVRSTAIILLLFGIAVIWAGVLPVGVLARVEFGARSTTVTEFVPDADGNPRPQLVTVRDPITLADLLSNLAILALTVVAAKNIPGVLEVTVLQRMKVAAGERYAIVTLVRYALVMLGAVMALRVVGVRWANVQWLVAALGVGLGFGLQESFANFFSGLVILFERPIRVGDTVTVGGVHGTVSRIRIRATTIIDFDRKELIVPNKEFVTSQLVNWTLSDKILRIVVPVGVSYESNVDAVTETLLEVALKSSIAIREPSPQAFFLGFGDSTLDFELRVFCDSIEQRLPLTHEMHTEIARAFRERNIEISYPQREIHIRSASNEPGIAKVLSEDTNAGVD